jgi:hypothetical protein
MPPDKEEHWKRRRNEKRAREDVHVCDGIPKGIHVDTRPLLRGIPRLGYRRALEYADHEGGRVTDEDHETVGDVDTEGEKREPRDRRIEYALVDKAQGEFSAEDRQLEEDLV